MDKKLIFLIVLVCYSVIVNAALFNNSCKTLTGGMSCLNSSNDGNITLTGTKLRWSNLLDVPSGFVDTDTWNSTADFYHAFYNLSNPYGYINSGNMSNFINASGMIRNWTNEITSSEANLNASMRWLGAYDIATTYNQNDTVYYRNGTFISLQSANTGNQPNIQGNTWWYSITLDFNIPTDASSVPYGWIYFYNDGMYVDRYIVFNETKLNLTIDERANISGMIRNWSSATDTDTWNSTADFFDNRQANKLCLYNATSGKIACNYTDQVGSGTFNYGDYFDQQLNSTKGVTFENIKLAGSINDSNDLMCIDTNNRILYGSDGNTEQIEFSDIANGVQISNSYYMPTTGGDAGHVLTSNGVGTALWDEGEPKWIANYSNMQTDCPSGNYSYGLYANGTFKCRNDNSGSGVGDNLGNHIATQNLQMNTYNITNVSTVRFNKISGPCDLSLNGSICSNATGTYIVG